jgi:hypothetical protein
MQAGSAGVFSSKRGGNSGQSVSVALDGVVLQQSWASGGGPGASGWLGARGGRMGSSAVRSGSSSPWPLPAFFSPRVDTGRAPPLYGVLAVSVVVCGVLGWWQVWCGSARLLACR